MLPLAPAVCVCVCVCVRACVCVCCCSARHNELNAEESFAHGLPAALTSLDLSHNASVEAVPTACLALIGVHIDVVQIGCMDGPFAPEGERPDRQRQESKTNGRGANSVSC